VALSVQFRAPEICGKYFDTDSSNPKVVSPGVLGGFKEPEALYPIGGASLQIPGFPQPTPAGAITIFREINRFPVLFLIFVKIIPRRR